ncbi:MAG: hypothetical protein WAM97_01130, partial [Acidimicrobiales bacterium]
MKRALLGGADFDSLDSVGSAFSVLTLDDARPAPICDLPETDEVLQRQRERHARTKVSWKRFFLVMGSYCLIAAASIYPSLLHGPSHVIQ